MALPKTGFVQQVYSLHLLYDNPGMGSLASAAALSPLEQGDIFGGHYENLTGRRSGVVAATPWSAAVARPMPAPFSDATTATSAPTATTWTDSSKNWAVNSQVGRRIESILAGVRTFMVVTSNTATVLTGAAWTAGTPANAAVGVVTPPPVGPQVHPGGPARPAQEASDNWYKAQSELGNTESV